MAKKRRRRKPSKSPYFIIALLLIAVAAVVFIPDGSAAQPVGPAEFEKVITPAELNNNIIEYEGFTVGFNTEMHMPNYVVWTLDPSETEGENTRQNVQFQEDTRIAGCATLADYRNSGFDRGHMAPAADMKWSEKAMADCHYLTNICPQHNRLNAGAWSTVEKNARKWALRHGPLVIVCGPVLSDRLSRTIGTTPVPVPERFFKVIIAPFAKEPMGIGFIMPNGYVEGGAQATVVSIDQVEEITGFDFFSELPDDIEDKIEAQSALRMWNK